MGARTERRVMWSGVMTALLLLAPAAIALAADYATPRTPWGDPDL